VPYRARPGQGVDNKNLGRHRRGNANARPTVTATSEPSDETVMPVTLRGPTKKVWLPVAAIFRPETCACRHGHPTEAVTAPVAVARTTGSDPPAPPKLSWP
jgi:hypothetical protein